MKSSTFRIVLQWGKGTFSPRDLESKGSEMSTEWIKQKRENWPIGSLERQLKLHWPGASNLLDAFKQVLSNNQEARTLKEKLKQIETASQSLKDLPVEVTPSKDSDDPPW